jgi:hypothetical protein
MYHGKQLMDRSDNAATIADPSAMCDWQRPRAAAVTTTKSESLSGKRFVSSIWRGEVGLHGRDRMRSKSDTAWRTAARMAALAEEADNVEEREHYTRLRDA